jgi:cytochrome c
MNKGFLLPVIFITLSACSDEKPIIDVEAADRGQKLSQSCRACHALGSKSHKIGPSLEGVFNKHAGHWDDYEYSDALANSGLIWNEQTLEAFLLKPQDVIPGTKMVDNGLTEQQASDVVEYLKGL